LKKISIILILFFHLQSFAQNTSDSVLIAKDVIDFNIDNLGNIYYTTSDFSFFKKDIVNKRTSEYSTKKNARIGSFDVSNPMRVIIFYPDFFTVKFLDYTLAEISSFNIRESHPDWNIRLVCSSNNNGLWLYDDIQRKLYKAGDNFKTLQESPDLFQLLGENISPNFMIESGDELFLNDPKKGILVFDLFGGYKKTIAIKGLKDFRLIGENIIYFKEGALDSYNPKTLNINTISTFEGLHKIQSDERHYYLLKAGLLQVIPR
jgi:hypothetical protein